MYVHVHMYVNSTSSPKKHNFAFFKRNILPYNTCAPQNIGQLTFLAFKMCCSYILTAVYKNVCF